MRGDAVARPAIPSRWERRASAARRSTILRWTLAVGAATGIASGAAAQSPAPATPSATALGDELDRAARAHVENLLVPGVSVAVVRGGEILLERGYGHVDVEWDVFTPLDGSASYEIGSVTKQFTAASILLLAEEGKVDLDADFTDYVDFDTGGRKVPVRRLLDHTSGIKGYTEMEVFGELGLRHLPRDTLVRLVEAEPFEFEPGTALIYNNSAYFLLGLIIEKVSGMPYERFVQERLFDPVGMADSYYCSESAIRAGRAHGYDVASPDSLIRARYLDHTWPFAAGSLCSTVGDLVRWTRALHGGRVLRPESYAMMTTPAPLVDGTPVRYAMGLLADPEVRPRKIAHGGGINGFVSQLSYYPDAELTVVVLQNSTAPPGAGALADRLAGIVLGPRDGTGAPERAGEADEAAPVFDGDLRALAGVYRGPARGRTMELTVSVEDGALTLSRGEDDPNPAAPTYHDGLRWDQGPTRFIFVRHAGRVDELRVDVGSGHYVLRRVEG